MRVLRRLALGAIPACLVAAMAAPASGAVADETTGHSVAIAGATLVGAKATVSGTASFAAITAPQSVGGNNTQWANPAVADAAGIDMTDAQIEPLANGSGLRFVWKVTNLPAQVPPEAVRYTWGFRIGTTQFQLQAKRTNLASITTAEDPINHVQQAAAQKEFFQLRGACVTNYEGAPVSGCYHLAFLNGRFDVTAKTVSIDLPYQTRDEIGRLVAPEFKPGVTLLENQSAAMSIAAAFQAVVGNTTTSDYTNGWDPYFAGPQVQLGVGPAEAEPLEIEFTTPATLAQNGSFSGTVDGVDAVNNTVYARACSGVTASCVFTEYKVR